MKLKRLLPVFFMTIVSLTVFFNFGNFDHAEAAVMLDKNISAKVTGNSLTLSWTAPDDYSLDDDEVITGYRVGYSTVEPELWYDIDNDKNWTVTEVSADTYTYTITGLKLATDYYYSIACVTDTDSSEYVDWAFTQKISTGGSVSSESYKTPEISGMYFYDGNTLNMSWDTIEGADSYKLAYSRDQKTWTYIDGIETPYYYIKGLNFCSKYYVKVVVMKDGKEASGWSDTECVSTKTYAAPTNVKASKAYYNYLTVSWTKVSGVDGYQIAYSTDNKTWSYKTASNVSSYKITGLKYNTKYYFKVRPLIDGKICGKWSSAQSASTKAYAPPSNIKATDKSYNYVTLSWTKADAVTGYKIAYSTDKKNWTYKTLGNVTSYKITKLKSYSKYYIKISSLLNNKYCSKWSSVYTVATNKYLSAPTNIKAKRTCSTATISWNKVSGASGYRLEYSLDKNTWKAKTVGNVAAAKLTGLKFGSKYYIRMVCLINGKISGKYSKTYYFTTTSLKTAVVTTKVTSNSIKASWKTVTGADGYKVYCYSTDGKQKITLTAGKSTTSWLFDELPPNTKYRLRVVPLQNKYAAAKYKNYYATTSLLAAPTNITATNHSTSIDLTWKKVSGANSYKIAYSTSANGNWKYMTVKNVDNCSVKNLKPTTKYYYRVMAYNGDKQISKASAAKVITTKAKNLQYLACPSCRGNGKCHSCKGSGKCQICGGSGMNGNYFCRYCGGSRSCLICHGHGTCRGCDGLGKCLADLNA